MKILELMYLMVKDRMLFPKVRNRTVMFSPSVCVQYCARSVASAAKKPKKVKEIKIGKEEENLFLSTDDIIIHIENPEKFIHTNTLLELIKSSERFQDTKNTQKYVSVCW